MKEQKKKGFGDHQSTAMIIENISNISRGLSDISEAIRKERTNE